MSEDIRKIIERVEGHKDYLLEGGRQEAADLLALAAFARDAISRIEELEAGNARLSSESDYRLGCQKAIGNRGPDKQQCDCRSYNRPDLGGSDPEVVLDRPSWMPEGERVNGVPVDFCLAEVIQHLWDNGVVTRSSCCGHNGKLPGPSIVLAEGEDNHEFIRKLIAEKDPRKFQLMQWKLVEV